MPVYEGVWYNHATEKLVLTLSPSAAGFLSAALVTWVHLVATSTWPIWRYLLYSVRQNGNSTQDVFHHQRQIMLRNSNTAAGAAGQLLKMSFAWRSYHVRSFLRTIVYLAICIFIFVIWTLCGLYAPYIYTRTGTEVLLAESAHCGWPVPPSTDTASPEVVNAFEAETINGMTAADTYVQQCYGSANNSAQCISYPRQLLPFTISDAECPFGENGEVCISVNSTVMKVDTGLLDSNMDFGINMKKSDTVQYRRVSTCSPLHSIGFVKEVNTTGTELASQYPQGEVLLQYLYGPADGYDFTYEYEMQQSYYPIAYTLTSRFYIAGNSSADINWVVNSTLYNQTDGDVSIAFLAGNHVEYFEPTYDPFFAAGLYPEDAATIPYNSTLNVTLYSSSHYVVPIACKEQHQFCLGDSADNCTPLMGMYSILNETAKLRGFSPEQAAAVGRYSFIIPSTTISDVITDRGAGALLASRTLNGVGQTANLPIDQWRKEVANWHNIGLARMQGMMLSFVTGPDNGAFYPYVENVGEIDRKYACKTQRVRDAQGSINFDMLGLIVLVVVGAGFIFLGLTFEIIVGFVSKFSSKLRARRARWLSEGIYHLHRTTLETQGVRDWQDLDSVMPKSHQSVERVGMEDQQQTVSFLHVQKA